MKDARSAWNAVETLARAETFDRERARAMAFHLAALLGHPAVHAALLVVAREGGHEGGLYAAHEAAASALSEGHVPDPDAPAR